MTAPKLRFKEFDGCWVEKIISEIADVRGGKRLPKGYSLQEENNGFPYITVTDMENGTVNLEKIRYVPLEAIDQIKRYRISVDEIYISVAGTLGLVGIIPQELNNANLTENADKLTNIKCNQFYLLHYLNNGSLSKLIDSVSTIGAQPKLALYAIQGMPIFLPSLDEQIKIASFLSAVDEKISQLTQKHELLSQYKQGMMQKLFSQQIRFKADDGSEFGEWEEKKLIDISNVITGNTPATAEKKFYDGSFLFVSPIDIQENRYVHQTKTTLTELGFEQCRIIPANSILFVCIGSTIGKVAQNKVVCATNQQINAIIPNNEYFSDYIYFQLLCHAPQIKLRAGTQAVPIINKTEFGKTILKVPCLAEQTKIANFLSSIDRKIEVVAQQIEQAKQWKKGLLQQMFV